MNTKNKEELLKTKKVLEKRLENFKRRNDNLEGNFVDRIVSLERRIKEIEEQIGE